MLCSSPRVALIAALTVIGGCAGDASPDAPPTPTAEELAAVMAAVDMAGGPKGIALGVPQLRFGLLDTPTTLYLEDGTRLQMYTKPRAPLALGPHSLQVSLGFDRPGTLRRVEARSKSLDAAGCDAVKAAVVEAYGPADPEGAGFRWRGQSIYVRWSFAAENRQPTCLVTWDAVAP